MNPVAMEVFKSEQRFRPGMNVFVNRAFEAFSIPQHTHDAIEISYVTEGTGYQYIDDTVVPVKRGDIFLLPIGTSHVYRPTSPDKVRTLAIINCVFRLEALPSEGNMPPRGSELHHALYSPSKLKRPWFHYYDKDSKYTDLFHTLLSEYRLKLPGYEVVVQSMLTQIMALLHRDTLSCVAPEKMNLKIQDALHFIKHRFHEDINLKQVAEHAFLSVSHLQRLFKQATGTSFTCYVQNLRIQRCCELLKSTSMTVQQIAGAIGYHDMKFFHTLFRQKTGMTPQEYRKNDNTILLVEDKSEEDDDDIRDMKYSFQPYEIRKASIGVVR
ncbi:AraC family transcriptional regulator [Paenibacillus sp. H1-7]|uniref:AraC family transcriptional regulator n=1 Tax=Paenibacillus sp. H1-7 TaxID=2282849 RepID=UPI001EF9515E|nr:AraC family transcriptional regulator [Paenibacillus sp. H1-7]ULL15079.1 AraC family transcriptional regulator [Paenibacillus sp. H1-7]